MNGRKYSSFILLSLSVNLLFQTVLCSYWHPNPVQWIGESIKQNLSEIDFCDHPICVSDSSRMGLWMNESANPCDNFYRYVCGSFLHYQARNERYPIQGLQQILYETINEQRRKVLSTPVKPNEIRPHKIAKSIFQKCVNSDYIKKFSRRHVLQFFDSLGGFPIIEGADWNATNLNKSKIFEDFPELASEIFRTGFEMIKAAENSSIYKISFKTEFEYETEALKKNLKVYKSIVTEFGIEIVFINETVIENDFQGIKNFIENHKPNKNPNTNTPITIKDFTTLVNQNATSLKVNWHKTLSDLLSADVDDDFEISVKDLNTVVGTLQLLNNVDSRAFSNFFFINFLLEYRELLAVYFISDNKKNRWGVERAEQRFEQCLRVVRETLPVAFTSLLIAQYTNPKMIKSAQEVANRIVEIITNNVENDETLPEYHRKFMAEKVRTAKVIVGYPVELLDLKLIEEFHRNLKLTGHEDFLNLILEVIKFEQNFQFKKFIRVEGGKNEFVRDEETRWADYTHEDELYTPHYTFEDNTIYYPSLWFQTPYFHPERPRYYKDSMFGAFLSYSFSTGLHEYMRDHSIKSKNGDKNHFDFIQLIFENYAKWDNDNNLDPPLPGFLFSNKQLFWFTLIHKNCVKLQRGFKDDFNDEKNAEAYFKENKTFQKAFGCDLPPQNMTDEEIATRNSYYNEFY